MPSNRRGLTRTSAVVDVSIQAAPLAPPRQSRKLKLLPPAPPRTLSPCPPPKKRGRPSKMAIATADSTSPSETAIVNKDVLFAGKGDPSSDEGGPPVKKLKALDINKTDATLQSGKQRGVQVPPRSLPTRINRVINPGAPDKPGTRRTSAQVAAEKQRQVNLQRDLDALKQRQVQILAELELQLEMADEQEERDTVRKLADGIESDIEMSDPIDNFTSSECNDSGDNAVAISKVSAKIAKKKRPAKGETRAAVDSAKESLIKAGKSVQRAPVKTSVSKSTLSSGLVPGWVQNRSYKPVERAPVDISDKPMLGGLDNEDASAIQPTFDPSSVISRANTFVSIADDDNSDGDYRVAGSKVKPTATSRRTNTAPSASKAKTKFPTVKSTASFLASPPTSADSISFETDSLPIFARGKWGTSFLPTLYTCLGSASNPWKLYEEDSNFIETLQTILDIVYPDSGFIIVIGDKIYSMAKDRLNEKRTYFGRGALKVVAAFFSTHEYAGQPDKIATYAAWAIRSNGPSVWGTPTPISCIVSEGHPDYIHPGDLFESAFVIELVSPFFKSCEGSCHEYGRPIGAFAMASAGVERAFKMYCSGERVSVGQFSQERVGHMIDDYGENAKAMTERRWSKVMSLIDSEATEDHWTTPSAPSMQLKRRTLYVRSSPIMDE